jgi:hypothetical protein
VFQMFVFVVGGGGVNIEGAVVLSHVFSGKEI